MKYVRTNDGIYEVDIEIGVDCDAPYYRVFGVDDYDIPFEEIIKQADTIEELCDELVARNKKTGGTFVILLKRYKLYDLEKYEIYGAIWTDKGLIYVAKMNNEGELELL